MKVLLGMCFMATRSGAELFVRDIALGLNRRGHSVIVYAPIIGDMIDELRDQSITCVTDLQHLAMAPDVIIGNTQAETVLCLAQFPGVPAISICHDRVAEHGRPPRFTRVGAYVAVDANCAERLTLEHGIPQAQVSIIQNGVDLRRFRPRSPLPERPRIAAIFSNYATQGPATEAVRRACAAEGIALEVIGLRAGTQAKAPEEILPRYDLVFAKARCATEAMAVGCAVVVLDESLGMAGLVTSANVADWRSWNFGRRLLARHAVDEGRIRGAIRSYSSADAGLVSAHIRSHASLESTVEALERLAVRALQANADPVPPEREMLEFARYVQDFLLAPSPTRIAHQVSTLRQEAEQARMREQAAAENAKRESERAEDARKALLIVQEKLARARAKLASLKGTRSWRATAPFRWIGKRVATLRERARGLA